MAGTTTEIPTGTITDAEGNEFQDSPSGRAAMEKARKDRFRRACSEALSSGPFDPELHEKLPQ